MRHRFLRPALFLLPGILCQTVLPQAVQAADSDRAVSGERPDHSGGGSLDRGAARDEPTLLQRAQIQREIQQNIRYLQLSGLLPAPDSQLLATNFAWPLRQNGISDPGVHGISNFVDQNAAFPGSVSDYNCGTRSYDTTSGYNHSGTDIYLWPWPWLKMANNQVQVVAAAAGVIVNRADGNNDQSCSFNNNPWNAIYVRHADGSVAWYGHLKRGSLTSKGVGASVAQGEYLATVGSSGNSTGPHLHLEVYDAMGKLNDPYKGSCNSKNATSWWASQRPYFDSAVNKLTTGSAAPIFPSCPSVESPNQKTSFRKGESAFFTAYYRDQLSSQTSSYRILKPDGSVYSSWTHSSPAAHYSSSYWYWSWTSFAPSGPSGTWRFEVTYNGSTSSTPFSVSP